MKLSTRSRYGTRMMLALARQLDNGPIQISDIAKKEKLSVKYLEQLILPLKQAGFINSFRGPKGGHVLAKPPQDISIGDIVRVLEGSLCLTECCDNPKLCPKARECSTRNLWQEATRAMYDKLDSVTLRQMVDMEKGDRAVSIMS